MRIDKLLSNLKYGSRNDIKKLIKKNMVKVNGSIITDSSIDVLETDEILVNNELVFHKEKFLLILNKPSGFVSANKDNLHKTVIDLIKEPYSRYELNICGRLDIDTVGLVLITNDGAIMHKIISPKSDIDWTKTIKEIDRQLYKNYGLDKRTEEGYDLVKFIEENVMPMD